MFLSVLETESINATDKQTQQDTSLGIPLS